MNSLGKNFIIQKKQDHSQLQRRQRRDLRAAPVDALSTRSRRITNYGALRARQRVPRGCIVSKRNGNFVRSSPNPSRYKIKLCVYGKDFKGELAKALDEHQAIGVLMGNRRTDPWSHDLHPITPSSAGWPEFQRIFPILDWSFKDVWEFLRSEKLPYCSLYDQGYTSLGEKHNSRPNPSLLQEDGSYLPAYRLENQEEERLSRFK